MIFEKAKRMEVLVDGKKQSLFNTVIRETFYGNNNRLKEV